MCSYINQSKIFSQKNPIGLCGLLLPSHRTYGILCLISYALFLSFLVHNHLGVSECSTSSKLLLPSRHSQGGSCPAICSHPFSMVAHIIIAPPSTSTISNDMPLTVKVISLFHIILNTLSFVAIPCGCVVVFYRKSILR